MNKIAGTNKSFLSSIKIIIVLVLLFISLFVRIQSLHAKEYIAPDYLTGWGPLVCKGNRVDGFGNCNWDAIGYQSPNDFDKYLKNRGFVLDADYVSSGGDSLDVDLISLVLGGCLLMWATGAGVGLVINIVRKLR